MGLPNKGYSLPMAAPGVSIGQRSDGSRARTPETAQADPVPTAPLLSTAAHRSEDGGDSSPHRCLAAPEAAEEPLLNETPLLFHALELLQEQAGEEIEKIEREGDRRKRLQFTLPGWESMAVAPLESERGGCTSLPRRGGIQRLGGTGPAGEAVREAPDAGDFRLEEGEVN